ncbi:MAG TPA: prohibitin family protein [Caldisericia bacterium]|mgnify:FL=1|nr:prohibitin family protein [Caldisericia bacterium]HOU07734.1 prohibitin family protein [Caldisericia bacterium]HQG59545.1 prohibitin family protein [Caldisericia bacterium]HQH49292.1 prohibitin family protein [Caldisericia bacterium]HQJ43718.1 prohibitin family protein [Caldisericia bacterium]
MAERYVEGNPRKNNTKNILLIAAIVLAVIIIWNGFVVIPAGSVGVVQRFGAITGQRGEGLNFLIPFVDQAKLVSVQTQMYQGKLETFSKQQQDVIIDITVNYRLDPIMVQDMIRRFNSLDNISARVVEPSVSQVVKEIIPDYVTDQIHLNRLKIRDSIIKELNIRMDREDKDPSKRIGVIFEDVNLVNITFSKEYTDAIERKQVAEQDALRAEYKRQEAMKNKEIAQVNAEAKKIEQQLVNQSLTQAILQNRWIEKWNGTLPQVMSGDGGGVILNLGDLKSGK